MEEPRKSKRSDTRDRRRRRTHKIADCTQVERTFFFTSINMPVTIDGCVGNQVKNLILSSNNYGIDINAIIMFSTSLTTINVQD